MTETDLKEREQERVSLLVAVLVWGEMGISLRLQTRAAAYLLSVYLWIAAARAVSRCKRNRPGRLYSNHVGSQPCFRTNRHRDRSESPSL